MAIAISVARFGANSLAPPRDFTGRSKQWRWSPRCESASPPCEWRQSRRLVSISLALSYFLIDTKCAVADGPFDKYVKRKKLDPLVSYVPVVILSQLEIKELEIVLEGESPQFASCRSLLRAGPASSLRINIRAVAQYAAESGNGKTASDEVDRCLRALEELDNLLLRASRKDSGASVKSMKAQINIALESLDGLLKTVPSEVLEQGQAIADSYRNLDDEKAPPDTSSEDLKQLEAIL